MWRLCIFIVTVIYAVSGGEEQFCEGDLECYLPGPENMALGRAVTVTPVTITCGNDESTFCAPPPYRICGVCNDTSHSPRAITDQDGPLVRLFPHKATWWQSISWWEAQQQGFLQNGTLKATVTISSRKSFLITGATTIYFYYNLPRAFRLEKSHDFGRTWTVYRFWADNCLARYPESISPFGPRCEPLTDFYPKYGRSVSHTNAFKTDDSFWTDAVQTSLMATDVRLVLDYPWTDGAEYSGKEDSLRQYFYSVASMEINARCHCNGHATTCSGSSGTSLACRCQGNTEGVDCERCLPLYNNSPWRRLHPCTACTCNNHSDSCIFDPVLGFGVCQNCRHNTTGNSCSECRQGFHTDLRKNTTDPDYCLACDCYTPGSVTPSTCHYDGQCSCKQNVTGRKCDRCLPGYFGLTSNQGCTACGCASSGITDASLGCDHITGQCPCKSSNTGRTCSECKPGFYQVPSSGLTQLSECHPCNCSIGGAYNYSCDLTTGQCHCRPGLMGRFCDQVVDGSFLPLWNSLFFSASQPQYYSNCSVKDVASNLLYQLEAEQFCVLEFRLPGSWRYFPWVISQDGSPVTVDVKLLSPHLSSLVGAVENSTNLVWLGEGLPYYASIKSLKPMLFQGLYLSPELEGAQSFRALNSTSQQILQSCWAPNFNLTQTPTECSRLERSSLLVSAEIFGGAKACSCNPDGGSSITTCEAYGGQCRCKLRVGGLRCDQCLPGFFGFSLDGCRACNCSPLGSSSIRCNQVSGQCTCLQGVDNGTSCSLCAPGHYGLAPRSGCSPCSCDHQGSSSPQCDDHGVCPCLPGLSGPKCSTCQPGFHNKTESGCRRCNCSAAGSLSVQCKDDGSCPCRRHTVGMHCDVCADGHFNLDVSNPDGCQPCDCNGMGSRCSSSPDYEEANITTPFVGTWAFHDLFTNPVQYQGQKLVVDQWNSVIFIAPGLFLGNLLPSYLRRFKVSLGCSSPVPSISSLKLAYQFNISGPYQSAALHYQRPFDDCQSEMQFILHENYTLPPLSASQLLAVLRNVTGFTITITPPVQVVLTLSTISLGGARRSTGRGLLVGYVELCECPAGYAGEDCSVCNDGYTVKRPPSTSRVVCQPCNCSNRSSKCDRVTGVCTDCVWGTTGDHCEICMPPRSGKDCRDCPETFYPSTDPSLGLCIACNCNTSNTVGGQRRCDSRSGQCHCTQYSSGLRCDKCTDNAIFLGAGLGCQACPFCHSLLREDLQLVQRLRSSISAALQSESFGRLSPHTFLSDLRLAVTSAANLRNVSTSLHGASAAVSVLLAKLMDANQLLDINMTYVSSEITSVLSNLTALVLYLPPAAHQITLDLRSTYALLIPARDTSDRQITQSVLHLEKASSDIATTARFVADKIKFYGNINSKYQNLSSSCASLPPLNNSLVQLDSVLLGSVQDLLYLEANISSATLYSTSLDNSSSSLEKAVVQLARDVAWIQQNSDTLDTSLIRDMLNSSMNNSTLLVNKLELLTKLHDNLVVRIRSKNASLGSLAASFGAAFSVLDAATINLPVWQTQVSSLFSEIQDYVKRSAVLGPGSSFESLMVDVNKTLQAFLHLSAGIIQIDNQTSKEISETSKLVNSTILLVENGTLLYKELTTTSSSASMFVQNLIKSSSDLNSTGNVLSRIDAVQRDRTRTFATISEMNSSRAGPIYRLAAHSENSIHRLLLAMSNLKNCTRNATAIVRQVSMELNHTETGIHSLNVSGSDSQTDAALVRTVAYLKTQVTNSSWNHTRSLLEDFASDFDRTIMEKQQQLDDLRRKLKLVVASNKTLTLRAACRISYYSRPVF